MPITIAYFNRKSISLSLLITLPFLMIAPYLSFWAFGGHFVENSLRSPNRVFLIYSIGAMWIAALIVFVRAMAIASQVIFDKGRAIWIEDGVLIYVRRSYFSVPSKDIEKLSESSIGRARSAAIAVHLRDGTEMKIPTRSLAQSREIVIQQLGTALGVAVVPV